MLNCVVVDAWFFCILDAELLCHSLLSVNKYCFVLTLMNGAINYLLFCLLIICCLMFWPEFSPSLRRECVAAHLFGSLG